MQDGRLPACGAPLRGGLTLHAAFRRLIVIPMQSIFTFFAILESYNRRRELRRLCRWAEHKRLSKPLRLYQFRLQDEEVRLNRHCLHHPRLSRLAYGVHLLNGLSFPPPRYPKRGGAWGYTRQAQTHFGTTLSLNALYRRESLSQTC